jgi:UDP-sugar transporter A1/2/3
MAISTIFYAYNGLGFMALHSVQFAFQPFLTKWCLDSRANTSSAVLVSEFFKFVGCATMLFVGGEFESALKGWTLKGSILAAGLPAMTYACQNLCVQVAYQNLDAVVFNIINQSKMLFTALLVFLLLGRQQSHMQVFALFLLFVAASMVTLSQAKPQSSSELQESQNVTLGMICIVAASALSGLGAALSEWALQRNKRNSYLFSAEIAVLSFVTVCLNLLLNLNGDGERAATQGLLYQWTLWTVVPSATQGLGGIVVGLITKVSGSVRKGFAVICGLILSSFLQWLIEVKPMPLTVILAVPLVAFSIYLHAAYPPAKKVHDAKEK